MPVTRPAADAGTTGLADTTAITPYLAVADARRALVWYAEAFGARVLGEPVEMPDGRVGHAELQFGGARLMLSDAYPEIGVVAPQPGTGAAVTLHIDVPDVDAVTARAVDAGAALERPPADSPYGRTATLRDPFGHRWLVFGAPGSAPGAVPDVVRSGDVGYASLWTMDVDRAATFYGSVLGWTFAPTGSAADAARMVEGATPPHGLAALADLPRFFAGQRHPTLFRSHAVDDVDAAVRRVRDAGGRAEEPVEMSHGRSASCLDPDGAPFSVHEAGGAPRGPAHGRRDGDLAYLVLEMVDGPRTRDFYAVVFGWEYSPGNAPDGWEASDVVPMTGMAGGHARPSTVPMYRVGDITAAVARVRAGGGSATEPQRQPYGLMSECSDDQGARFFLGQL
jgi:predicted enzyme related to lactoylglutathione lyase